VQRNNEIPQKMAMQRKKDGRKIDEDRVNDTHLTILVHMTPSLNVVRLRST